MHGMTHRGWGVSVWWQGEAVDGYYYHLPGRLPPPMPPVEEPMLE